MKRIQILGTGCQKCKELYETTLQIVKKLHLDAKVKKVEDINEIMKYGVIITPALAVDGEVKVTGRIPKPDELITIIG